MQQNKNLIHAIGYVPGGASIATFQSGAWTPNSLECVQGATLVMNGGSLIVEVHAPGGLKMKLSTRSPDNELGSTLDYFNGHLILCGGISYSNRCYRGDYQESTKGVLPRTVLVDC